MTANSSHPLDPVKPGHIKIVRLAKEGKRVLRDLIGRHVQARLAAPREHWPEDLLARLILDMAPEHDYVLGDRKRLVQIVANLLNNAAKYTPDGGRIHVEASVAGPVIEIQVKSPTAVSNWIWGAFKMPGGRLHHHAIGAGVALIHAHDRGQTGGFGALYHIGAGGGQRLPFSNDRLEGFENRIADRLIAFDADARITRASFRGGCSCDWAASSSWAACRASSSACCHVLPAKSAPLRAHSRRRVRTRCSVDRTG